MFCHFYILYKSHLNFFAVKTKFCWNLRMVGTELHEWSCNRSVSISILTLSSNPNTWMCCDFDSTAQNFKNTSSHSRKLEALGLIPFLQQYMINWKLLQWYNTGFKLSHTKIYFWNIKIVCNVHKPYKILPCPG